MPQVGRKKFAYTKAGKKKAKAYAKKKKKKVRYSQRWQRNAGYKKPIGPLNVEAQKVSARVLSLVDLLVDQVHVDIIQQKHLRKWQKGKKDNGKKNKDNITRTNI